MANALTSLWAVFNDVQFNTVPGLQIYSINPYAPTRTLNLVQIARRSVRKLSSAFYTSRTVTISLYISQSNRIKMEQSLDKLLKIIQASEGVLVIPQSGTQRQYTATLDGPYKINNKGSGGGQNPSPQGGFIDLTLTFQCSDSRGYDTTYTIIRNQLGITSQNTQVSWTQGGGSQWQAPFIQVKYTSVTGSSSNTVRIGNQANGQEVQITRQWSAGDIIQVDAKNGTVKVNGLDVAFTGGIPEFETDLQTLYIIDDLTARTFDLYAYVYNRYD